MIEWKKIKIDKLCNVMKGITGLAKATPGQYPLVTTGHKIKTCNEYQFNTKAVCIPLVSSTGHGKKTLSYVHYQEGKFALGSILAAVIPKDDKELDAKYLHLYLSFYKDRIIVPLMRGAANVSLSIKDIKKIDIPLPPINIQKSIIGKYYRMKPTSDKLLKLLNYQIVFFKQLRQAILQEAVEGKLTVDWRKKHTELISGENSAENLLKKIKIEKEQLIKEKKIKKQKSLLPISEEEKSFKIPEGWIWIRVGEVIEIIMGQSPPGYSYNKKGVGLPFFQGKKEFGIIYPKGNSVWCHKPKRISRKNDILISVRAPVGDINLSDKEYSIGRGLSIIRNFSKNLLTWYTYFFLDAIKNQWDVKGSFFSAITKEIIINRIFPLPSIFEQQVIVNRISNFMNIVDELEKQVIERKEQTTQLIHSVLRETFEQK